MDFGASDVNMYGVGLGKYIGNWYLRWRTLIIPSSAGLGFSNRALARYYFSGDADDYFEINGGFSLGGEFQKGTKIFEKTTGQSFGAVLQKYFHPRLGLKISYTFNNDNKYPLIENYISTTILTRW
jgi:YaiO family outer membrane protein